jgi:hypothetical protein
MTADQVLVDFEFLAWIERCMFFRKDMALHLKRIGLDDQAVFEFTHSDAVKAASVVQLYQDIGMYRPEEFKLFIMDCWNTYQTLSAIVHPT